jgi:fatty-acyl-CoA synthase
MTAPLAVEPLACSVYRNLEVSAERYPDRAAIIYYGTVISYADMFRQVAWLAGYLSVQAGVRKSDRVLLCLQNSPQYIISYYAILRIGAVVVPVNPMSRSNELAYFASNSGAVAAIIAVDNIAEFAGAFRQTQIARVIIADYHDYLPDQPDFDFPAKPVAAFDLPDSRIYLKWAEALSSGMSPDATEPSADDWCLIAYSSGSTGAPKGCLHTHASVNAVVGVYANWLSAPPAARYLACLPLFHVTGMQNSMNVPLFHGSTIVLMARWDRRAAIGMIRRYKITHWRSITTMMIDFLSQEGLERSDLASLTAIGGGGAAMPEALASRLSRLLGLPYIEGYGMTETAAATIMNPADRPKAHCLGIPVFGVDCRVIDPDSLQEVPAGETGEIIVSGPQLFQGYWQNPKATDEAVLWREGERYLRTGDLGYVDSEGYFFLVDRLKRMINVAGYKVWPAEVEAVLQGHAEIHEVCVIAGSDQRRGECVKALIIPKTADTPPDAADLEAWCRVRMAAYKVPSKFAYVDRLPRTASGKIAWRELQECGAWAREKATPSDE